MAVVLNTPLMAVYEPKPMRLMAMQKNTETHTAAMGVPVSGKILTQSLEAGRRPSRENANVVRASACIAVKQTNLRMMKAHTVNVMPPAFPRTL